MSLETPNQIHAAASILYTFVDANTLDIELTASRGVSGVRLEVLEGFPFTVLSLETPVSPLEAFAVGQFEFEGAPGLALIGPPLDPGVFTELDTLAPNDVALAFDIEFPTETEGEQVRSSAQVFRLPLLGV